MKIKFEADVRIKPWESREEHYHALRAALEGLESHLSKLIDELHETGEYFAAGEISLKCDLRGEQRTFKVKVSWDVEGLPGCEDIAQDDPQATTDTPQ